MKHPPNPRKRAVVLVSGGLDSAVAAMWALERDKQHVYPLVVDYGQRHREELPCADNVVAIYRALYEDQIEPLHRVNVVFPGGIRGSALTDRKTKMPRSKGEETETAAYVPGRNTFLLSLAASYAEQVGAERVYAGFTVRGFPDCRPEYVRAFNKMLKQGLFRRIEVVAPLIHMTKVDVYGLALQYRVPIEETRSCLRPGKRPCGICSSCVTRRNAREAMGEI